MPIDRIELRELSMPLMAPFETSFGVETDRHCIIVRIEADGLTGWGECPVEAGFGYSYETTTTAWHALKDFLIPHLLGKPIDVSHAVEVGELLRGHSVRRTAFLAWCHGFGLWGFGTYWLYVSIHDYGYTPPWLATPMVAGLAAFMALFFAGLGAIYARFRLARTPLLALPALWVLGEWVRSWFLTGFPWLFTGYAFIDTPLAGYAPVTGVFGISLIAVFTALALVRAAAAAHSTPTVRLTSTTVDSSRVSRSIACMPTTPRASA